MEVLTLQSYYLPSEILKSAQLILDYQIFLKVLPGCPYTQLLCHTRPTMHAAGPVVSPLSSFSSPSLPSSWYYKFPDLFQNTDSKARNLRGRFDTSK